MFHQYNGGHGVARVVQMLSLHAKITVLTATLGLSIFGLYGGIASAATYSSGSWTLAAPSTDTYSAQVQQPINPNGSSVWSAKRGVIPVQFTLTDTTKFVFESIVNGDSGQTPTADNAYSVASYTPPAGTTVSQLTSLVADYTWTYGTDHGGSLRWSINVGPNQSIFVYFGDEPGFTSETSGVNGSGTNLLSLTDLRFDTSQLTGGSFYDTWTHALALAGTDPVNYVALVADGGWRGDQVLKLTSASVNGNSFTFPAAGTAVQTNAPSMYLDITQISGSDPGVVDETTYSGVGDTGGQFRAVDGKYMYNLDVSSLHGAGTYRVCMDPVKADGGSLISTCGTFVLK